MIMRAFFLMAALCVCAGAAETPTAPILNRLVAGNDELIAQGRKSSGEAGFRGGRGEAIRTLIYVCGYVSPLSKYHHDATLVPDMEQVVAGLATEQLPSGLYDSGNLESPPDTGFLLEALAKAQLLLVRDANPATEKLRANLRIVIEKAAHGVAAGGIHTPNHRWGVCAALALTNRLYPDPRYPARIAEWLAEGIDQDADGQYAERSPAYSAKVVNPAFYTLAAELKRSDLIDHVRRNLAMTYQLTDANGDITTLASRRQDQLTGAHVSISEYYLPARWLALHDKDGRWAALAEWIERDFSAKLISGTFDPNWPLPFLLEDPALAGPLPAATALSTDYAEYFPLSGLGRIRHGAIGATISGGNDNWSGFGAGSGLAMNPTFFTYRRGGAMMSVRVTPAFFGTGFFYSEGLERNGANWRLHQALHVPYHQPLPAQFRRADGLYKLSPDGRYFSRLDFANRPKDFRTLETTVNVTERDGGFALEFDVKGQPGVPVTIELAFTGDGKLEGVTPLAELAAARGGANRRGGRGAQDLSDMSVLKEGSGRFVAVADTIEFGSGSYTQMPGRMEGEDYTWVNGSLKPEGQRVYLTGVTPFHHTLTVK